MARLCIWMVAAFCMGTAHASGQSVRPPLQLGLGITGIANLDLGDFGVPPHPWADARVTVPISDRFAIEGTTSVTKHVTRSSEKVVIFYTIQMKQNIGRRTTSLGLQRFLTYGAVGAIERLSSPRHTSTQYSEPGATVVGAGVEREVGRHIALRADAQLMTFLVIPLGARFTGSVSIPIGQYARR